MASASEAGRGFVEYHHSSEPVATQLRGGQVAAKSRTVKRRKARGCGSPLRRFVIQTTTRQAACRRTRIGTRCRSCFMLGFPPRH
jgi:hypothetical protein